jgi:predicted DNA-binding protein (UPF0278 family)
MNKKQIIKEIHKKIDLFIKIANPTNYELKNELKVLNEHIRQHNDKRI